LTEETFPKTNGNIQKSETLKIKYREGQEISRREKNLWTDILIKTEGERVEAGVNVGIKPKYLSNIPSDFSHVYDYVYPNLQFYSSYEDVIMQVEEDLDC